MRDAKKGYFRIQFNLRIKLEFHGAKVISDAEMLLYRELIEVFGMTAIRNENAHDDLSTFKQDRFHFSAISKASICSVLAAILW